MEDDLRHPSRFFCIVLNPSLPPALAPKKNATSAQNARTIVTFANLSRESPGVVISTEPSFVVLIDDSK
jgi:hypothetical protein